MLTRLLILFRHTTDIFLGLFVKRINIGCGRDIKSGWVNLDIVAYTQNSSWKPDVKRFDVANKDDLVWLSQQRANLMFISHVIGYLNFIQFKNFLEAAYNGLLPGGELVIEFPCAKKISKKIIEMPMNISREDYIEVVRALYAFDGLDAYLTEFNKKTYIFGYSADFVNKEMMDSGFDEVKILDPKTHGAMIERDVRLSGKRLKQ
jgi:hypothetical protein